MVAASATPRKRAMTVVRQALRTAGLESQLPGEEKNCTEEGRTYSAPLIQKKGMEQWKNSEETNVRRLEFRHGAG